METTQGITQMGPELAAAFALVAAEIQNPAKTAKNPHFNSLYAPLDEIMAAVRPLLGKQGLFVVQSVTETEHGLFLATTLYHRTGQSLTSHFPFVVAKNDPQGYAAGLTYARRAGICALLGIAGADEDDDGNTASGVTQTGGKAARGNGNGSKPAPTAAGGNGSKPVAKAPAAQTPPPAANPGGNGGNGDGKLAAARAYVMPFGTQKRPELKGQALGVIEASEPTLVDFLAANTKNADLKAALDVLIAARAPVAA